MDSMMGMPKWIWLQVIESCNLRCKMCYEWGESGAYKERPELKQLELSAIEQIINDCKDAKPHYDLFGGEPLLYPRIKEVLTMIKESGSTVSFPTNGTLLSKYAEMIVEAGPSRVWVSLDGPEEINDAQRGKGVYQKAMKGIDKLYELKQAAGTQLPEIGVTCTITPVNYIHLERFFFEELDLSKLNCFSMELQAYLTEEMHEQYVDLINEKFGVTRAPMARGFVRQLSDFSEIDFVELQRQLTRVIEYCANNNIYLNHYPKDVSAQNLKKYFSADALSMSTVKSRCIYPWLSTEVNARGDVTSCHAYYDLSLGNVYEQSLKEIWRGTKYKEFRKYLKKNLLPICTGCCLFYNDENFSNIG
ncbi:radical SAM protein [Paenibacillus sinopodophylli]|uniref:radical SAM protein n=1 Tax=Paenibacillus sinopodophylli TaxID=1837342 RepID=UPI001FEA9AFC|nr:radical SAM protein [Paenibacillus sinopodophylli]